MSDEVRVQGWHDPVMVGSAATVADHNVPGAYPATLIHMRTKLKLPLAKEARNHVPVLRHGLTFGTPYPANLPKGQSRGVRRRLRRAWCMPRCAGHRVRRMLLFAVWRFAHKLLSNFDHSSCRRGWTNSRRVLALPEIDAGKGVGRERGHHRPAAPSRR